MLPGPFDQLEHLPVAGRRPFDVGLRRPRPVPRNPGIAKVMRFIDENDVGLFLDAGEVPENRRNAVGRCD